jgi:hypothetical protein
MKKAIKIIAVIVVLLIAAILILPYAFKGKIVDLIKKEANKNLNATLAFSDVDLSLIRSFPNLSVAIEDLSITGKEPFLGDTLTSMKSLNLTLDVMSVVRGEQIEIKKISLDRPLVAVKVLKDGSANYDIAIPSEQSSESVSETDESAPVSLQIQEYEIKKGRVVYDDESLAMILALSGLNHTGKGNFAEDVFTLYTNSSIDEVTVDYDGIRYLKKAKADLKADLAMDLPNMKFTFMENEVNLNNLALGFDGWLAMPAEDIDMDISFSTTKNDLTTLLSLVPAEFTQDLEGVDVAGTVGLAGYVKGIYNDNSMPGFGLKLDVDKGRINYPDLPRSIENIDIHADIKMPEGNDMDLLTVDVPRFYMELGKTASDPNTFDAMLKLRNPMSDPFIDTKMDADLNLGSFKDLVPLESDFELSGDFSAHFALKGALSAIESQNFNKFIAGGDASLNSFEYSDADYAAAIPEARMSFSPEKLDITTFKLIYDEINMELKGFVDNYIVYALSDTTLHGRFNFTADRIDLNKYMTESEQSDSTSVESDADKAPTDSSGVLLIPDNLDIVLDAKIGQVIYDDLVLDQISGTISLANSTAAMRALRFSTLQGQIEMNGAYSTQNPEVPNLDFDYKITNISLRESFDAFNTVQKLAPIAKHASGKISSEFSLKTDLDQNMEPIYETMNGRGSLSSNEVVLEGGKFLSKMASALKSPKLERQEIDDFKARFVVENGKVTTQPFDVKINNMEANISGYSSFDETMDYMMKMKVPRSELGGEFNAMAEGLLAQANAFLGGSMSLGEFINVDVRVHGNIADPKVTPTFAGMEGGDLVDEAKDAIKEEVKEVIEETKEDVKEEAAKQAEKILADAQKQADRIIREANDAAKKIRDEADKQAQALLDEAKNPLAKSGARIAGDQLKKEANKQATNLENEAQKRADDIMAKAKAEADKIQDL